MTADRHTYVPSFLPDANIELLKLAAKQFLKITLGVNKQNPTCDQECYMLKKLF